ncbi:VanW family protein [Paenisporosarcina indica]|uniref:VanW family protein n=1 Tax=Paenisporosarcina indica TaxID=650093 RepID=UPI00094F6885|nr:VanW family protein [Paenisporosarcina indica]
MNNKLLGSTLAALLGSTVLFFGVSQAGSYLIDDVIFPTKGFGDQTYIGPYDVSNLPEKEAAVTVSSGVQGWYSEAQVQIKLQDAVVPFPLEAVEFNTTSTLTSAQDGTKNGLEFDITQEAVDTFLHQQFSPIVFSEEEVATVTDTIRQQLAAGRKDQVIDISSALLSSSSSVETVVTNITFDNVEQTPGIQNIMSVLDGYEIQPKSTFSFLEFLDTVDVGLVTESDLTAVASILYASVLNTNFGVVERSIGPIVPKSVPLGFEASINRELGVDFVFSNPNTTSFTININDAGTGINTSLTGYPFVYSYETEIKDKEEFSPKTIKQYSAFVGQNTIRVITPGQQGVQVAVVRNTISNATILETKDISKDFYPPVHKVEVHPLTVTATPDSTGTGADTGSGTGTTDGTGTTPGGTTAEPSTGTGTNDGPTDGTTGDGGSTGTGSDTGTGGNTTEEEEEPQYDKGGNLIPSGGK